MQMPELTDAHRKLELLVGNWVGEETLHPSPMDPVGGPAIGRVRNVLAVAGFGVVQDYEQVRNGKVNFSGHGVFRYEPTKNQYELVWLDSFGQPPGTFEGGFVGDVLTLTQKTPHFQIRAIWDLSIPGKYVYNMDMSMDGVAWMPFMEGTYRKQVS